MRFSVILAAPVALAACVPAARPPATPLPRPVPVLALPPPPVAADWRDWPVTPGTWRYARDEYSTVASYVPTGLTFSCDNDRRVRLRLDGRGSLALLIVRTTTASRSLNVAALGHPPTGVAASFSARDPLLDAVAFSRGRFVVEQAGAPTLVVPAWPEIGRVIEDCRG